MPDSPHTADIIELKACRERDYTEILTQIGCIAANVIDDNENVPIHLVAMAIACRMIERFPDIVLTPDPEAAAEIKALREALEDIASTDRAFVDANGTDGAFMKIIERASAALKDHRKVQP